MIIHGTVPLYEKYLVMSIIYLLITTFIILGVMMFLTHKPYDLIYIAIFVGIARAITLNALWGGWKEMITHDPQIWSGKYLVLDIAYWGMQWFFSALIPIIVLFGAKYASESTREVAFSKGVNIKYIMGILIMGLFTYVTWSLLNEYGIFFIWGLENFSPEVAVWFPEDLWFLGFPWMFWTAPFGIIGIIFGFHFSKK